MREDELVGWHHWLERHKFEWVPEVGDGQGSLVCCSPWGWKELDMTEWVKWTELNWTELGENVSYPRTGLSLVPELMMTQHNVLLMEMLFLGSILMIIIVTNLVWESVSQDSYPLLHKNSVSCPETLPGTLLSLANLVPKLPQDVCLGKGSCGTLRTLFLSILSS